MVQYGRVDCLSHPVCVNFLKFKWKTYGLWLYIFFLTLYIIFLGSLTTIVINPGYYFRSVSGNFQGTGMGVHEGHMNETAAGLLPKGKLDPTATLMVDIVTVYSLLCIIRETLIMISRKARYFNDHSKLLQWISYTLCFLFTAPFTVNMAFSWQWEIGAMAVFFAWFNLLIILQRFDFFGIYVVMFLEILRTLLAALSVFSIVIVAFGLSFHMLMKNEHHLSYSTPLMSMMKVSMMTLEPDYAASFNNPYNDNDESTLPYGATTFLMLIFWIGLAVGDIETVQKNANLKRLAGQVELHSDLENKMPLVMLARVEQYTQRHHPNISKNVFQKLLYRVAISDDVSEKSISSTDIKTDTIAEVLKQKQRLRETFALAEKNNQLLRLLARRFEIQTEDETWDEGPGPGERTRGSLSAGTQANFLGFETGAMRRPFLSPRRISGTFPQHGTGISTSPASPYGSEQHLGGVPPRTATSEPSHVPVRSTSEPKVNVSQNVPLRRTSSAPKAPMEERTATPESSSELNSEPTYSLWEESQPETDHSDSDQSELYLNTLVDSLWQCF
ncbi:hypothetical protein BaRGS_00033715 [Batillaria attramentaria]|uniref:Uncharacterized protein n=1 Tax=Batillaria attramentaria TaxID=370345 RepID=A0ABD0JJK4_9CAEN